MAASPSIAGSLVLITGGNAGIGKETAHGLAKLGAKVVIGCRSKERALAAIADLVARGINPAQLEFEPLDLESFESTRGLVDRLQSKGYVFDIVIANAGLVQEIPTMTRDGFEFAFRTTQASDLVSLLFLTETGFPPSLVCRSQPSEPLSSHQSVAGATDDPGLGPNRERVVYYCCARSAGL
jgi:NAD(P)-dependent dehydrogenase (short-subunit alcohol dehydrogenase family)